MLDQRISGLTDGGERISEARVSTSDVKDERSHLGLSLDQLELVAKRFDCRGGSMRCELVETSLVGDEQRDRLRAIDRRGMRKRLARFVVAAEQPQRLPEQQP